MPKPKKPANRFELRLDDVLFDYVDTAAKRERMTATEFVRSLIRADRRQNNPKPNESTRVQ